MIVVKSIKDDSREEKKERKLNLGIEAVTCHDETLKSC